MQEAGRRTTSRRDLAKHHGFEQISPEVGELDEAAFDDAMDHNPDETLAMLADLTAATDPKLRALAKRLAGRLMLASWSPSPTDPTVATSTSTPRSRNSPRPAVCGEPPTPRACTCAGGPSQGLRCA